MNKWIGIGRLTRDPEVRYTQAGKAVASFSLAVDSGFGDNKRTDFINVTCWDKMAEMVGNNLIKGIKVLVEGRLQISNYEKDGVKKQSTEIVAINIEFLEKKEDKKRENKTDTTGFGTDVNNDIDF
jgi:single-strand DNA-binding protein